MALSDDEGAKLPPPTTPDVTSTARSSPRRLAAWRAGELLQTLRCLVHRGWLLVDFDAWREANEVCSQLCVEATRLETDPDKRGMWVDEAPELAPEMTEAHATALAGLEVDSDNARHVDGVVETQDQFYGEIWNGACRAWDADEHYLSWLEGRRRRLLESLDGEETALFRAAELVFRPLYPEHPILDLQPPVEPDGSAAEVAEVDGSSTPPADEGPPRLIGEVDPDPAPEGPPETYRPTGLRDRQLPPRWVEHVEAELGHAGVAVGFPDVDPEDVEGSVRQMAAVIRSAIAEREGEDSPSDGEEEDASKDVEQPDQDNEFDGYLSVSIDPGPRSIRRAGFEDVVDLSPQQIQILSLLVQRGGKRVSKLELMTKWVKLGGQPEPQDGTIHGAMSELNRKVRRIGLYVSNDHGEGYRLVERPDEE